MTGSDITLGSFRATIGSILDAARGYRKLPVIQSDYVLLAEAAPNWSGDVWTKKKSTKLTVISEDASKTPLTANDWCQL